MITSALDPRWLPSTLLTPPSDRTERFLAVSGLRLDGDPDRLEFVPPVELPNGSIAERLLQRSARVTPVTRRRVLRRATSAGRVRVAAEAP